MNTLSMPKERVEPLRKQLIESSLNSPYSVERRLCQTNLAYLLVFGLGRTDCNNDWVKARCAEVQANPDGYLDLWAREHYKSTIITFALTIQDILRDPEITIGLFSHTRPIAKAFLRQIKQEFERNETLKAWFPDILYANPKAESPKWSEDEGIVVKRKGNPKEATVEASGVVDGQPTSKHFALLVYDDVVTRESVSTPDMMAKTTDALALSFNLGAHGGKRRFIGTRYHFCTVAPTRILMADFSHKPICDVAEGDVVVGWGMRDGKRYLRPSRVIAVGSHEQQPVNKYTLDSGRSVTCTASHKWWRGPHGAGNEYASLGLGYHDLGSLRELLVPTTLSDAREAAWLAGMFDGEGSVRKNTNHPSAVINIVQTMHNPDLVDEIRNVLGNTGFEASEAWHSPGGNSSDRCCFNIMGGWRERYRFLTEIGPRRTARIIETLFTQLHTRKRKLETVEDAGLADVYWLETETGNYVAEGFCSKNSDTYHWIMKRGTATPRIYPATHDGKVEGEPVFLSREELAIKRRDMGPFIFGAQMLLNPTADETQGFKQEWLRYASVSQRGQNLVILVDAASAKKKTSDYTSAWCLGLGADKNVYVHDMVRDRLSLTERADLIMAWHRKWQPQAVGYEQYGMMADIEHIRDRQDRENYRFDIKPLGGAMPKVDRIRRLIPWFERGRIFLMPKLTKTNYEGRLEDLTQAFINDEYLAFPVAAHDDMLDALARFLDPDLPVAWPRPIEYEPEDEFEAVGRDSITGY